MTIQNLTEEIYKLLLNLPRHNYLTPTKNLPPNGIYVFYERGETWLLDGRETDRIVRIGTHKSDGRFPGRIRQHYGPVKSFGGQQKLQCLPPSMWGSALITRSNPDDNQI